MGDENEKSPFSVAGAIRHPISLGATAVIAITLVFKAFLEMDVFPQLSGDQAFVLLNRMLTYIFVFAVVVLMAVIVTAYLKGSAVQQPKELSQSGAHEVQPAGVQPVSLPVENPPPAQEPSLSQPPSTGDVDTGGGAYVSGDVDTAGGDFIGRNQINE